MYFIAIQIATIFQFIMDFIRDGYNLITNAPIYQRNRIIYLYY